MRFFQTILFSLLFTFSITSYAQKSLVQPSISSLEQGLALNDQLIQFIQSRPCEFGMDKSCDRPLSIVDIEELKDLFSKLDIWNTELKEKIIPLSDRLKGEPFIVSHGTEFSVKEDTRFNYKKLRYEKYLNIVLNDDDVNSQDFLLNVQIASSTTLMMYDSLFKLSHTLAQAKKARSILENDLGDRIQVLRKTFSTTLDEDVWNSTKNNLSFIEQAAPKSIVINYFEQYIAKSFTASKMNDDDFIFRMRSVLFVERILSETQFLNILDKLVQKVSEVFGNTAGQVQTRDGKLKKYASDPVFMQGLKSKLKPLDILMEKTPFRLTDQFIPGFFGHVAIWLGNIEELLGYKMVYQGKEIYLIDHPLMKPYLEDIYAGKSVVEALRIPGVTTNNLEHFMDIDDFLVLRMAEINNPSEKILRTIAQIGKPYDFNFDVETENAIVCSELAYIVFNDVKWPVDKTMGRFTISPDHVAWKAMDSTMNPIILFHDGKEVTEDLKGNLKTLLELPGGLKPVLSSP